MIADSVQSETGLVVENKGVSGICCCLGLGVSAAGFPMTWSMDENPKQKLNERNKKGKRRGLKRKVTEDALAHEPCRISFRGA